MNILTILGYVLAPLGIVLGVIIKGMYDRRINKDTTKVATQVATQTGRTQEMEVAFEGLTLHLNSLQEQLKELRVELKDAKTDGRRTVDDLTITRRDLRRLELTVSDLRVERAAFLVHIAALESLIPVPPGAPPRPAWMIPEVHSDSGDTRDEPRPGHRHSSGT